MKQLGSIHVKSKIPPVVELDSEAHAAYVRFSSHPVARTLPAVTEGCVVTVDYDAEDEVIGIEMIGVDEFSIRSLLDKANVKIPNRLLEQTRYVTTGSAVSTL